MRNQVILAEVFSPGIGTFCQFELKIFQKFSHVAKPVKNLKTKKININLEKIQNRIEEIG